MRYTMEEYTMEVALVTTILRENEIIHGTLFQTFDRLYEIALAFVVKYGVNNIEWGVEMEYEETVVAFGVEDIKMINKTNFRITKNI